jgi:hypothetical protein
MTENRNSEAAWSYHEATKHSHTSIRTKPHFMDWSNQPLPFKIYPTLELLRLPNLGLELERVAFPAGDPPGQGQLLLISQRLERTDPLSAV